MLYNIYLLKFELGLYSLPNFLPMLSLCPIPTWGLCVTTLLGFCPADHTGSSHCWLPQRSPSYLSPELRSEGCRVRVCSLGTHSLMGYVVSWRSSTQPKTCSLEGGLRLGADKPTPLMRCHWKCSCHCTDVVKCFSEMKSFYIQL